MKNKDILYALLSFRRNGLRSLLFLAVMLCTAVLSAQQSYTFTTAGATGRYGPTQGQITAAYASTNLSGNVTIVTQGIQEWAVPATGAYAIAVYGAQGCGTFGGRGAQMIGEFQLTAGQVLRILVGQQSLLPANASYNAQFGGGGGSYVTTSANVPLVVAGGGGGNWATGYSSISDAPVTTAGNTGGGTGSTGGAGGANGAGGSDNTSADGGGGFSGNGTNTAGGFAFLNGGVGGFTTYGEGGFGGGGGTSSFNNRRGGGGGGYSGGGGSHGSTNGFPEGGGGGSYNSGTNQNNLAGANSGDGLVVITKLCSVNISASTNPICQGGSVVLSTNALTTLSWGPIGASSASSIIVSPSVTTSYSVTGTGTPNCTGTAILIVTVQPLPNVSAVNTPTTVCPGKPAILTGFGAMSYTWSNNQQGLNTTVIPTVNTTYTVSGTNSYGCVSSNVITVNVYNNILTVSPNTVICENASANLSAFGAVNYTWSSGSQFASTQVFPPLGISVYSVIAVDVYGCELSNTISVNVDPKPNLMVNSDKLLFCLGETVSLSATGADVYLWSDNSSGDALVLTPVIDIPYTYSVTGTGSNGCSMTAAVSFTVNRCVGLYEQVTEPGLSISPNPTQGPVLLTFNGTSSKTIELLDMTGRVIATQLSTAEHLSLDLGAYAAGLYYIKIHDGQAVHVKKLVKQ